MKLEIGHTCVHVCSCNLVIFFLGGIFTLINLFDTNVCVSPSPPIWQHRFSRNQTFDEFFYTIERALRPCQALLHKKKPTYLINLL